MKTGAGPKGNMYAFIQIYLVLNEDPNYVKSYLPAHPSGSASSHRAPGR
jgi:hypothetical protein